MREGVGEVGEDMKMGRSGRITEIKGRKNRQNMHVKLLKTYCALFPYKA